MKKKDQDEVKRTKENRKITETKENRRDWKSEHEKSKKTGHISFGGIIRIIIIVIIVAAAAFIIQKTGGVKQLFHNEEGKVTTVTKADLEKVIKESKLYTAEYPYNSYATVKDEKGNVKYYVAYTGTVKAGFDVEKVSVSLNEDTNVITISLPEIKILDINVNVGPDDYIFKDKKSETENVSGEANQAAYGDLEKKANENEEIIRTATDNAKMIEKELVEPWVNQVDPDKQYKVEVVTHDEN